MAEESGVCELEGLEKQLQSLLWRYSSDELRADSEPFCSDFCKLVKEYASCWQVPLPQLRILEIALCYFAQASTFFTSDCDHVLHTLSSLVLSLFELLLFFDQKDFDQEPLKQFTVTFQECHLVLAKHQNVHLLQVERLVQGGGPWASPALQAILSESNLPQNEVDGCISSELPVFFELRVRYLLSCERISEAMALAKCCAWHPIAGQHLFFLQVYLTWLYKTSQHDCLHKEVADLNGKDAIHMICSLECEEEDELLLALSTAFLSQQLRRGDMCYLCDLVFVWTKLHSRLNTSKQALLEEIHQLMLSATNVNSIFPFIRAILQEVNEDGIQFCVELCANALQSCLPCDIITKSLIYKTIAGLLPNDLEVCRACALLVFFLERTVESYKMVYLLYMHPDQEYHVECCPVGNHVRFETLQILKKDLYFDPEFWNLIALRTNCLKLMSEKVVGAALEEIMEDKWISSYYTKESAFRSAVSVCWKRTKSTLQAATKKRHHKEDTNTASKKLKVDPGKTSQNVDGKKKDNQGSRTLKETSAKPLRRSFWKLDRIQDKGEHRRTTRLSEKNLQKRKIRKPRWLLEDSGTLEENNFPLKIKKHGVRHEKHHPSSFIKRSETGQLKNNIRQKPSVNSDLKVKENDKNHQKGISLDYLKPDPAPEVILELSLPDNELIGTFTEDTLNRQRGFSQVLLYKPTVKLPDTSQPVKTVHRKEVILRARDATMFVQQLHCYTRREKGKGIGLIVHSSVSTITRSSVQGSPPKDPSRELCEKPAIEMKGGIVTRMTAAAKDRETLQAQNTKAVSRKTSSAQDLPEKSTVSQTAAAAQVTVLNAEASAGETCEEPAVEMKVTIASQSPVLDKVSKAPSVEDISKAEVSQTSTAGKNQNKVTDEIPLLPNKASVSASGAADTVLPQCQYISCKAGEELNSFSSQAESGKKSRAASNTVSEMDASKISSKDSKGHVLCKNGTEASYTHTDQDSISDISALTLVTEMVTELAPEQLAQDLKNGKQRAPGNSASKESSGKGKPKTLHKIRTTSSCCAPEQEASVVDVQGKKGREGTQDISPDIPDNEFNETLPESEESKLEYCCTFCHKEFKGSRVVAHAMFHYRKDECMFCGTMFKDDLLAMMHLSDHIEKLKRIKETPGKTDQGNGAPHTKETSTPKTSSKAKDSNISVGRRSKGRPRRSTVSPTPTSQPDLSLSESRKLRSNKSVNGPSTHEKLNTSKHLSSKISVHKLNGYVAKKKELNRSKKDLKAKQASAREEVPQRRASDRTGNHRVRENQDTRMDSSVTSLQVDKKTADKMKTESVQMLKTNTKQNEKVVEDKNVAPLEKVCCPVGGCSWFTDLSKNRVSLLYHALENHSGEIKPLELAFRVGNSKCSICMRVLWSFEHFQHHVERHRVTPRHPCLHQGCTARFKTGIEMRRHTRKHSPLQAMCCLPGCSKLFICLWALNLHEREHYASKSTKPDMNTNVQTGDKCNDTPVGKKRQNQSFRHTTITNVVHTTVRAARKLREQAAHESLTEKDNKGPPLSAGEPSLIKQELKERKESKDSNVLKNLSNKDTSAQPTAPHLRLRQTLRKVTNTTLAPPKLRKISSSLLKHSSKVRHKLRKKQVKVSTKGPKRRGRPKLSKSVHDENITAGRNKDTVRGKMAQQNNQKKPDQLLPPSETVEIATVSNKSKEEGKNQQVQNKDAEMSTDDSKSKKSTDKQIESSHVKQKVISRRIKQSVSNTLKLKTQKSVAAKIKKLDKVKNCSVPSDSSMSKKRKIANGKVNTKTVEKTHHNQHPGTPSSSRKPTTSKSAVLQFETKATVSAKVSADEKGKANMENTDSTQNGSDTSVHLIPAQSLTVLPTTEKIQKIKEENSKKTHIAKEGKKSAASSNSNKKHNINKNRDKKLAKEKWPGKTCASSKCEVQQDGAKGALVKSTLDEEGKGEASVPVMDSSGSSVPATTNIFNEKTCPPANSEERTQKATKQGKTKKANATKDPSKASRKRKDIQKEDKRIVKKQCKDHSNPSASKKPAKSKTEVQPLTEVKTGTGEGSGEGEKTATPSTISGPGYGVIMNGQASKEVKSSVCKDTLEKYSKKPYMRPPPTAYLDEKYITMPKRRKEMFSASSPRNSFPEQAGMTVPLQRQRCANCFATFSSAEELQNHLQLQKCSNLFGFDSDDEGTLF